MSNYFQRSSHPIQQIITFESPRGRKNSVNYSYNIQRSIVGQNEIEKEKIIRPYYQNFLIPSPKRINEIKFLGIFKKGDRKVSQQEKTTIPSLSTKQIHQMNKLIQTSITTLKKSAASTFYRTSSGCQSDSMNQSFKNKVLTIKIRKENCFDNFHVIKQIGQGKFSKVSVVRNKQIGYVAALKTLSKNLIKDQVLLTQLIREIKILSFINHPNIVSLYGVGSDSQNIHILQQMGCDGELYSLLCKCRTFSEQAVSFIMRSLLSAVSYLHSHKILHRDIKPQNVVIVHGMIKLCDLGWSIHTNSKFRQTICGTPLYSSPQLLQGNKYSEKIDLWALGIMAYQLKFGKAPFQVKNKDQLYKIITDQINFPQQPISYQFQYFIRSLLHKNPKQRLTAQMMLNHPFILKYIDFQTCQQLCTKLIS